MAAPDISFIKAWCRVDGSEFDPILPGMIGAATVMASHEVGVNYEVEEMPQSIQQWVAAQVAHWLETPGASVMPTGNKPQRNIFLDRLLDPYRTYP